MKTQIKGDTETPTDFLTYLSVILTKSPREVKSFPVDLPGSKCLQDNEPKRNQDSSSSLFILSKLIESRVTHHNIRKYVPIEAGF